MAEPIFNRIETASKKMIFGADLCAGERDGEFRLTPDMTGDGLPDYVRIREEMSLNNADDAWIYGRSTLDFSYEVRLYSGVFGRDGKFGPNRKTWSIIDYFESLNNTQQLQSTCQRFVLEPRFEDLNNDARIDISFYVYSGDTTHGYDQVILLNETDVDL